MISRNEDMKLSFTVQSAESSSVAKRNNVTTLQIDVTNGVVVSYAYYDFDKRPLILTANVEIGDAVEIVLMSFRVELYVNGELVDENWPAGNRMFNLGDEIESEFEIRQSHYTYVKAVEPAVIGTFRNAEGWRPAENVFVGDCMPYVCDGRYHVLYLKDRRHHSSKWSLGAHQWAHISTADFDEWQIHPLAVEITDQFEASICTGSFIKAKGKYYLFYTVRNNDFYRERLSNNSFAYIRRSVSEDGYHFEKDESFGFTLSKKYHGPTSRDPKVVMGDDGLFHMLVTTSVVENNEGCLAHLVSEDLDNWTECDEPALLTGSEEQPECPDYFSYNGKYYMLGSLRGVAHYRISDKPFSDWREPKDPVIHCSTVPKGAVWGDRIVFTGFKGIGGYGGSMTFSSATFDEDGELVF
ncbi:MAG: hypothetical protein J6I45_01710 [Clostridia bacterium]|nr:hypothetical protein [Clostridia bacterium]